VVRDQGGGRAILLFQVLLMSRVGSLEAFAADLALGAGRLPAGGGRRAEGTDQGGGVRVVTRGLEADHASPDSAHSDHFGD
jgi:hypothetical protein